MPWETREDPPSQFEAEASAAGSEGWFERHGLQLLVVGTIVLALLSWITQRPGQAFREAAAAANDATFAETVASEDLPVVVTYSAEWCSSCTALKGKIADMPEKYDGKLKFVLVDVDESPGVSNSRRVEALPTQEVFFHGKAVERVVGSQDRRLYEQLYQHWADVGPNGACTTLNNKPC